MTASDRLVYSIKHGVSGPASAYLEWGTGSNSVKIIALVKGPRQQSAMKPSFDIDVSFAEFSISPLDDENLPNELALYIKEAMEQSINWSAYQQMAVSLYVKVLQGPKSVLGLLSASIVVAGEALKHAGVSLEDNVLALGLGIDSGENIVHLCYECADSKQSLGFITIGMMMKSGQVCLLHQTGKLPNPVRTIENVVEYSKPILNQLKQSLDSCSQ